MTVVSLDAGVVAGTVGFPPWGHHLRAGLRGMSRSSVTPDSSRPQRSGLSGEGDQHNLGMRADAHGWAPCARPAGGEHLETAEPLQPITEFAEHPPNDQGKRKNLASVRMPRELQVHPRLLHDREPVRNMVEQNIG